MGGGWVRGSHSAPHPQLSATYPLILQCLQNGRDAGGRRWLGPDGMGDCQHRRTLSSSPFTTAPRVSPPGSRRPPVPSPPLMSMSCSSDNGWLLTGSVPFSAMYFSISRRSYTWLDTGDTHGCSGTSLETAGTAQRTAQVTAWSRRPPGPPPPPPPPPGRPALTGADEGHGGPCALRFRLLLVPLPAPRGLTDARSSYAGSAQAAAGNGSAPGVPRASAPPPLPLPPPGARRAGLQLPWCPAAAGPRQGCSGAAA